MTAHIKRERVNTDIVRRHKNEIVQQGKGSSDQRRTQAKSKRSGIGVRADIVLALLVPGGLLATRRAALVEGVTRDT